MKALDRKTVAKARKDSVKAISKATKPVKKNKKAKVEVAEDNEPKSGKSAVNQQREFLLRVYNNRLDTVEKKFNIVSSNLHIPDRLSTGTLIGDLVTGGGLVPGTMVQISGREKGGKSTKCMTILRQALLAQVPIINYWDAESALNDPNYAQPVIGRDFPLRTLFFGPNKKARLYQENVLEDFYNSSKALLRQLPNKAYRADRKKWYLYFMADKEGRAMMAAFGYKSYDQELYKETGQLWCETYPGLQGIIFCDSYPALVPADVDESDEDERGMALDARAFSKNIKKVKGILKRKGFVLVGVNQIRLKPGFNMGNPEYEPGGEALKFYADVRIQNRPRGVPSGWDRGRRADGTTTGEYGSEKSVLGKGYDSYSYTKMVNTKNKTGQPYLEGLARIWFKDHDGKPHGYDPVFDTWQYYKMTGRVSGNKKGMKFAVDELKGRKLRWEEFKLLILAETMGDSKLVDRAKKELGFKKNLPKLRAAAFAELRSGATYKLLENDKAGDDEDLEAGGDE
jgi:RecA/RadA recombinase